MSEPVENTDVEIWREVSDRFVHSSIHVTDERGIGINVGGSVFVKSIEEWHRLAAEDANRRAPAAEQFIEVDGIRVDAEYVRKLRGQNAEKDIQLQKMQLEQPPYYAIQLQRLIENFCHGREIPDEVFNSCPYHAQMLIDYRAEQQQQEPVGRARLVTYEGIIKNGTEMEAILFEGAKVEDGELLYTHPQPQVQPSRPADEKALIEMVVEKFGEVYGPHIAQLIDRAAEKYKQPRAAVPDGFALLPRALTAENGGKALLMGEFSEPSLHHCTECTDENANPDCEQCNGHVIYTEQIPVSWNTIKAIYKKIVEHFAAAPAQPGDAQGGEG